MRRTTVVLLSVTGLLAGCLGQARDEDPARNADAREVTLTITANAVAGGKNARGADWIANWVIPRFTEAQKAKGVDATVRFEQNGAGDEDFKTKVALDLKTGGGGDVVELDGIWLGEFAQAGLVEPLDGSRRRRAVTGRSRCSPRTRSASCWRATTSGARWSSRASASPRWPTATRPSGGR